MLGKRSAEKGQRHRLEVGSLVLYGNLRFLFLGINDRSMAVLLSDWGSVYEWDPSFLSHFTVLSSFSDAVG